jgi:LmbE family N-acetylglucosaminyl deacetylase
MTVLVIAPHPDDETFGCGGTLVKHVQAGDYVHVAVMTQCAVHRYADGDLERATAMRHAEAVSAVGKLGVQAITFGTFPEVTLESVPDTTLIQSLEQLWKTLQPGMVYAPHYADVNQDHRKFCDIATLAFRPWTRQRPNTLRLYMVDPIPCVGTAPRWNVWEDIADTLDTKLAAVECYVSELRPFPHPRSKEAAAALAGAVGSQCGARAAERFELAWEIR